VKSVLLVLAMGLAGCGYHVAGHADLMPKTVKTIAVPAFANPTTRFQIARMLPEDVAREFIARTRYNIVPDPNQADAVLTGVVNNYSAYPIVVDPKSGRATGVQVIVNLQVTLTERATGKTIYQRNGYEFRDRYTISIDPQSYFDENGTAMARVSKDAARSIVSAILENF
jgi:outer membrane lipopolysaccharide assembly protein LptE/RlpB